MNEKNTLRNSLPIELLLSLKKGKKIEIKKSHKGRFTEYCGGNVTNECISRGKNSPDPKIRKQATFAANARKWNHKVKKGLNGPEGIFTVEDVLKYYREHTNRSNTQEGSAPILDDIYKYLLEKKEYGISKKDMETSLFGQEGNLKSLIEIMSMNRDNYNKYTGEQVNDSTFNWYMDKILESEKEARSKYKQGNIFSGLLNVALKTAVNNPTMFALLGKKREIPELPTYASMMQRPLTNALKMIYGSYMDNYRTALGNNGSPAETNVIPNISFN